MANYTMEDVLRLREGIKKLDEMLNFIEHRHFYIVCQHLYDADNDRYFVTKSDIVSIEAVESYLQDWFGNYPLNPGPEDTDDPYSLEDIWIKNEEGEDLYSYRDGVVKSPISELIAEITKGGDCNE